MRGNSGILEVKNADTSFCFLCNNFGHRDRQCPGSPGQGQKQLQLADIDRNTITQEPYHLAVHHLGPTTLGNYGDAFNLFDYGYLTIDTPDYSESDTKIQNDHLIQNTSNSATPCIDHIKPFLPGMLTRTMYDPTAGSDLGRDQVISLVGGATTKKTFVSYQYPVMSSNSTSGTYMGITYPWRGLDGSL